MDIWVASVRRNRTLDLGWSQIMVELADDDGKSSSILAVFSRDELDNHSYSMHSSRRYLPENTELAHQTES